MPVAVLLAMAWFGETHANPAVPPRPPRYVTVEFDANGGKVDAPSIRLYSGMAIGKAVEEEIDKELLPTPERDGYKFEGWYTERTGGWKITPGSVMSVPERDRGKTFGKMVAQTVTAYAHWRTHANPIVTPPKRYVTVKFDANGGKVDVPSIRLYSGMAIGKAVEDEKKSDKELLPTPKRDRYKFEGWYTERNGGWKITPDSVISAPEHDSDKTVTQTVTVYAHWRRAPWRFHSDDF